VLTFELKNTLLIVALFQSMAFLQNMQPQVLVYSAIAVNT